MCGVFLLFKKYKESRFVKSISNADTMYIYLTSSLLVLAVTSGLIYHYLLLSKFSAFNHEFQLDYSEAYRRFHSTNFLEGMLWFVMASSFGALVGVLGAFLFTSLRPASMFGSKPMSVARTRSAQSATPGP